MQSAENQYHCGEGKLLLLLSLAFTVSARNTALFAVVKAKIGINRLIDS